MRFLQLDSNNEVSLTKDLSDHDIPARYAILSHTWSVNDDDEVTFANLQHAPDQYRNKTGYKKIEFCGEQAKRDGINYFWVDTCCINKANLTELSEAIMSMYRWYQNAEECYVYLSDVSVRKRNWEDDDNLRTWESSFRSSRWFTRGWFTRGWTLQELLAPRSVVFFSREGQRLGTKRELEGLIHEITSLPIAALSGSSLSAFSVEERKRWARGRTTKKKEDQAYCLLGIFDVQMSLRYGEGDYTLVRLTRKINKTPKITIPLRVVEGAEFDAYDQAHQGCHPATRVDLLQAVRDWARDERGTSIFWLNGMAGTGKSTISWTITKWLADLGAGGPISLGASFFFKRGEGDRGSAISLFPTIASQLARHVTHFDVFLAQAVKLCPQICSKSLGEQFGKLICEPLRQLPIDTGPLSHVVVIDALDECDHETDIRTVLQLWSTLPAARGARLRLFLTSRPQLVIRLGFQRMLGTQYQDMILHEIPKPVIEHDFLAFLTDALAEIREEYNLEATEDRLTIDWPGSRLLQDLTNIAIPLFIVAATIYRFIRDSGQPQESLETVLQSGKSGHLSDTAQMYSVVLQAITASVRDAPARMKRYREFQTAVGAIVCLAEPLSRTALAALLDVPTSDVRILLQSLHAVLQVPKDGNALIRPLHLSFSEYLTSPEAQIQSYGVDAPATHSTLWKRCLRLLSGPTGLRADICGLGCPGMLRSEVVPSVIAQYLSPAIQYACRYWVHHVQLSTFTLSDEDEVHKFLQHHFLHWLEALSLLNRLADAIELISILLLQNKSGNSDQVVAFLEDAKRFVLANRFMVEQAPLQLYSSALAFAPENCIIRDYCGPVASWIQQRPTTSPTWGPELQRLEGHTDSVQTVAFSPDGLFLASGSYSYEERLVEYQDKNVRLWQVSTGQEIQQFRGHTCSVTSVCFSPDGSLLASVSLDKTVRLWQVSTGQEVQKLEGHAGSIETVAFSPDGSLLASGSQDQTIRLWQVCTGLQLQKLEGCMASFSPNGSLLALVTRQETVRLWEVSTGREVQKLAEQAGDIYAVAFSPAGSLLATATSNRVILWELSTGQKLKSCDLQGRFMLSIAFSPNSSLLALGASFGVRLWQVDTGEIVQNLEGHTDSVTAVTFSPDGSLLASASTDRTVRLWQVDLSKRIQKRVVGINGAICEVAFSRDGSLLASRSFGGIVRIWQVSTSRKLLQFNVKYHVSGVAFSPDNSLVALALWNNCTVLLWQVRTNQEVHTLQGHTDHIWKVVFSPDGSMLASASQDKTVRLWQVSTGREMHSFEDDEDVSKLAFSPDSSTISTGRRRHYTNLSFPTPSSLSSQAVDFGYSIKDDWVELRGQKLLWLPHEYRSHASAVYGNTIGIGQRNGCVCFLRLNYH